MRSSNLVVKFIGQKVNPNYDLGRIFMNFNIFKLDFFFMFLEFNINLSAIFLRNQKTI